MRVWYFVIDQFVVDPGIMRSVHRVRVCLFVWQLLSEMTFDLDIRDDGIFIR